jgi:hypothetical protein
MFGHGSSGLNRQRTVANETARGACLVLSRPPIVYRSPTVDMAWRKMRCIRRDSRRGLVGGVLLVMQAPTRQRGRAERSCAQEGWRRYRRG